MTNVHGRTVSSGDLAPGSPLKSSKENEGENMNAKVKSASSVSSGAVLKQSNSADRNVDDGATGGSAKKAKSMKSSSTKGASKKKSLKRL